MSRKKVWNSIVRRKKKNHMDLSPGDESPRYRCASPLLRVSTLPTRGCQHRHTLDPELSSLREHHTNQLFMESEFKSLSLPRGQVFPPQITVEYVDEANVQSGPPMLHLELHRPTSEIP